MRIRNFLSDESGAVAVDWVVITAGITGMGLAVIATASGGLEDLSGEIRTTLGEQMEAVVALATAGMTATAIWNDPANSTNEFANIDELSFSTVVDFTTDAEGIIFEFGATGRGAVLYQHDGVLYLQAGNGNDFGEAADRGEASWQVVDGTATIEGSMNANGGLALMVNGETVSQSSFNARVTCRWRCGKRRGLELGRRTQSRRLQPQRSGPSRRYRGDVLRGPDHGRRADPDQLIPASRNVRHDRRKRSGTFRQQFVHA
jgi:Flp pilus assembly pilin Flp